MKKTKKIITLITLTLVIQLIYTSCILRLDTPFSITNKSKSDIICGVYFRRFPHEDELLKSISEDIRVHNEGDPKRWAIKPNQTKKTRVKSSRKDLIDSYSLNSIIIIWIVEIDTLKKLDGKSSITWDDLDYYFLGNAKELEALDWKIVYKEKKTQSINNYGFY